MAQRLRKNLKREFFGCLFTPNFPIIRREGSTKRRSHGEVKIGGSMKYAIFESGGKQYKAVPGDTIRVDRLPEEKGKQVELDQVLFLADDKKNHIGTPTVKGAKVLATVEDHIKGKKIVVFKYKPKVRYRVKQGHRQRYTLLRIDDIKVK
jgi:large subunit ribosomal protein L21